MIDNNKFDDLSRLFRLCRMMSTGMQVLQSALKRSIIRRGKAINQISLGDDLADNEAEESEAKTKGKSNIRNANLGIQPAITWVQDVLEVKDKFDLVWTTSFQNNREVEMALNDVCYLVTLPLDDRSDRLITQAFGTFVNLNEKCSEFISLFIDDHLKRGIKGVCRFLLAAVGILTVSS